MKRLRLRQGDAETRAEMRRAHEAGRHGDGSKPDVVKYWAETCADCHAVWEYELREGAPFPTEASS